MRVHESRAGVVSGPDPATVARAALASPALPLTEAARARWEPRLDHDLSRVRIHTTPAAAEGAAALGAAAFAVADQIVFAPGRHAPETPAGDRLLGHELVHVVQQGGGAQPVPHSLELGAANSPLEREAETVPPTTSTSRVTPQIQRQTFSTPPVTIRSPVFEEAATQPEHRRGRDPRAPAHFAGVRARRADLRTQPRRLAGSADPDSGRSST